jgi:hypothetical protein
LTLWTRIIIVFYVRVSSCCRWWTERQQKRLVWVFLTHYGWYVVEVFNSIMISVSFNGIRVVCNMLCLELWICHYCEYYVLIRDDTCWWSLMTLWHLFYLIVCELCVTCFVWNHAYFIEYIIDMINDYTDELSLHILLWEHMTC